MWFGARSFWGHLWHLAASVIATEDIDSRDWMGADDPAELTQRVARELGGEAHAKNHPARIHRSGLEATAAEFPGPKASLALALQIPVQNAHGRSGVLIHVAIALLYLPTFGVALARGSASPSAAGITALVAALVLFFIGGWRAGQRRPRRPLHLKESQGRRGHRTGDSMNTRSTCLLAALGLAFPLASGCGSDPGGAGGSGGSTTATSSASTSGGTGGDAPSPCLDGKKNGTETDVDCGGTCSRCDDGKVCTLGADCTSTTCTAGVCAQPTCTDKAKDGKETDVDCGGLCPPCSDGKSCAFASDCTSGVCTAGLCQASTCNDGVNNGNETGVDCGGACPVCPDGQPCTGGSDCASTICEGAVCKSNVTWADRAGDAGDQTALGVAVDAQGNTLVVGSFHGTIDWGGGPLVSAGGSDVFVVKLDGAGKHLWSKRFGDAADQSATAVAVGAAGDLWITGSVVGNVDFGGGIFSSADPLSDAFLAHFAPTGVHLHSQRFLATSAQRGTALTIGTNGDLFFGGVFDGTMDLGCGALPSAGSGDVFVARLDSAGACVVSKRFGDASTQELLTISTDLPGNVLLGGRFKGTVNFGGAALTMPTTTFGGFAAKLDPAFAHVFSTSFGATTFAQEVTGIAADPSGNVFVGGSFSGTLAVGPMPLTSAGLGDLFVTRLDPAGTAVWAVRAGDATDQVGGVHLAADQTGNVLVGGTLQGTIDLGGGPLTSVGGDDVFVAKLDSSGNHVWSVRLGDAAGQQLNALALGGSKTAAIAGAFSGSPDFGGTVLKSAGATDAFAALLQTP